MFLYAPLPLPPCGFISFRVVSNCGCSTRHHTTSKVVWGGGEDRNIKLQTELTFQLTCICSTHRSVSPDMLFLGLYIASNLKIYLETLAVFEMARYIWPSMSCPGFGLWGLCFREMDSLYSIGICLVIVIISIRLILLAHVSNRSLLQVFRSLFSNKLHLHSRTLVILLSKKIGIYEANHLIAWGYSGGDKKGGVKSKGRKRNVLRKS